MTNNGDGALPPDAITPGEAAALVRVSPEAVRQWVKTRRLRGWRRGLRMLLVSRAEVLELAAGRVETATRKAPARTRTAAQRAAGERRAKEALRKAGVVV